MAVRPGMLLALASLALGCGKEKGDDHVECEAPGGCAAVKSTLATNEMFVELLADGHGGVYAALFGSGFNPTCAGGVVCHGELWRIDARGDVRWKEKEDESVSRLFRVPGGAGYVTAAGKVVVLDADGGKRFSVRTDDPAVVVSIVADDLYLVAGGELSRVNLVSGDVVWAKPYPEDAPIAPKATGDGYVLAMGFTAGTDGSLTARAFEQPDGDAGWTATLPAQLSAPAIVPGYDDLGPTLLVSDVLTLRGWSGAEMWSVTGFEGFRFVSRTRTNGYVAGGPFFDQVTEYRRDGTVAWSRPMPGPVTWISPTPDGHVLVGQVDGVVRKLKGDSGITLWDYGAVDTVKAQAPPLYTVNGNIVFWGANVGLDSDTHVTTVTSFGQGLERWNAGARVVSGALSDDDDVFVATTDGRIYLRESVDF